MSWRKRVKSLFKCLDYFVTDDPNAIPWPEILYYLICVFILVSVTFFLYAAQSEIAWKTSLNSLDPDLNKIEEHLENYRVSEEHYLVACFLFAAALIGIKSAYSGYESGFYAFMGVMVFSIALQAHAVFLLYARSTDCNYYESPIRKVLRFHVNNYYDDAPFMDFMDKHLANNQVISQPVYRRKHKSSRLMGSLQTSLGCCGYDSHYDYLDVSKGAKGFRDPLGENPNLTLEVPSTCCTRLYAPNIHCSVELWNNSDADLRLQIYTSGCTYQIIQLCHNIFSHSLQNYLLIFMTHIILLLLSVPLIIVQVKVLRQLATENPFSYVHARTVVETLDDYEKMIMDEAGDSFYAHDFHRNSDFVLTEELASFIETLKGKYAQEDEQVKAKLPTHVMVARKTDEEDTTDYKHLPFVTITKEDKARLEEYSSNGRYNTELTGHLLKYAASVLNMDPNEAEADMKQAELMAMMNAYENAGDDGH